MDNVTLNNITESCQKYLLHAFVSNGLQELMIIARYCTDKQLISQVEELAENYHCMLSFLASGGKDEDREITQDIICRKALENLRIAHRDIRLQTENTRYAKAFHELQNIYGTEPEVALLGKWENTPLSEEQLQLQDHIFSLIWTSPVWSQKDTAQWYEFLSRQSDFVKIHLIGAVILSAWEYFDKEKLSLLFLFTDTESLKLNALSITSLILLAEKYHKEIQFYPQITELYLNSNVTRNIPIVLREKLLMLQTLIAIKKEQEEMEGFSLNISPEKMENLMNRKMENLRRMLQKGLDVNLGNRTELWYKCEFLHDNISHWWMPFEKSSPFVEGIFIDKDGHFNKQAYKILDMPTECDIDRYSMFSYMAKTSFKDSFIEKMSEALDHIEEISKEEIIVPYTDYMKQTMQNLYRIFSHSPIKGEIDNPFLWPHEYWTNQLFKNHFTEEDVLKLCTEMKEADILELPVTWLNKLSETSGTSYEMLKLKSSCLLRSQKYTEAIDPLTQILFLQEDDEWALNAIQECYGNTGKKTQQLEIIQNLISIHPDKKSHITAAAMVLMELHRYEEALKYLFQLDYKEPDNVNYQTSIETCALHLKKFDLALRYNQAVLEHKDYEDRYREYLNAGHAYFGMGDWKEALIRYKMFRSLAEDRNQTRKEKIIVNREFVKDAELLMEFGIKMADIMLMLDMMYI